MIDTEESMLITCHFPLLEYWSTEARTELFRYLDFLVSLAQKSRDKCNDWTIYPWVIYLYAGLASLLVFREQLKQKIHVNKFVHTK